MTTRKPTIRKGPASQYPTTGEAIYEFGDGQSGGLIALRRVASGRLVVDLYRLDDDVLVLVPAANRESITWKTEREQVREIGAPSGD